MAISRCNQLPRFKEKIEDTLKRQLIDRTLSFDELELELFFVGLQQKNMLDDLTNYLIHSHHEISKVLYIFLKGIISFY